MLYSQRKEKALIMNMWINLFNVGLYFLVFLLIAVVVFGFIWTKYCK
ncbi:hypothetical protein G4O51_01060 [Candidatus Bathyarchaeota archaeon A05DMB-2]|jgi:hypothetical protein|nr:hypothetical protein [Candidatus Bathyarchaeota archaeon A05DMB-2]